MDTIESAFIKGQLTRISPCVPNSNQPLFKLVWSNEERELRKGTFRVYCENIFVREEEKVENTLKYDWLPDRWIVEQWFGPEVAFNSELPNSGKGSYEPIYVFEDNEGNELPLAFEPIQFLVQQCLKPKKSSMLRNSLSRELQEQKVKETYRKDVDALMDEGPLVSQFHDGSAILSPGIEFDA